MSVGIMHGPRLFPAGSTPDLLERTIALAFCASSVMTLLNLNGMARMWIGAERAFSAPLLICCLVMLGGLLRVPLMDALNGVGVLILAVLVSYCGIGIVVSLVTGTELRSDADWHLTRHVNSIVLILATAVGGRVLWQRIGGERVLLLILGVLICCCALVVASPLLVDIYRYPPPEAAYRYFGSFGDPNEAGVVACLTAALAFSFLAANRFRVLALGALILAVWAVVGTSSRTALIVLAGLVAWNLAARPGIERKRVAVGLLFLLLVGGITAAALSTAGGIGDRLLPDQQQVRLNPLVELVESGSIDDAALGGRMTLWRLALAQALSAPLFGHGLGMLHRLEDAWYNHEGVLQGAHNEYLMLWGEAGFIPFLLFIVFLGAMLRVGAGIRNEDGSAALLRTVSGWGVVLAVYSVAHHGVLTQRACGFIVGLGCAAAGPLAFAGATGGRTTCSSDTPGTAARGLAEAVRANAPGNPRRGRAGASTARYGQHAGFPRRTRARRAPPPGPAAPAATSRCSLPAGDPAFHVSTRTRQRP